MLCERINSANPEDETERSGANFLASSFCIYVCGFTGMLFFLSFLLVNVAFIIDTAARLLQQVRVLHPGKLEVSLQVDRSKLQFELHGLKSKLSKVVVKVKLVEIQFLISKLFFPLVLNWLADSLIHDLYFFLPWGVSMDGRASILLNAL